MEVGKTSGWREVIRGLKTEKSLLGEWKTRSGDGGEKQRMTYFGEIRAWRDKRYLRKRRAGMMECGLGEGEKKTLKREKFNI